MKYVGSFPAECPVTFDEAAAMMPLERDNRVDDGPRPNYHMEYPLASTVDADDD